MLLHKTRSGCHSCLCCNDAGSMSSRYQETPLPLLLHVHACQVSFKNQSSCDIACVIALTLSPDSQGSRGNHNFVLLTLLWCAGWARYVLTWQMQLSDSKVRPSGSPGRDSSLMDLMACPFPEHSPNCKFVGEPSLTLTSPSSAPHCCCIGTASHIIAVFP